MSALTTRILVLGVVDIFGPANGYQLRRELLSWEVERWAHLNPGSIYSMLTTLEKQGAIERHDIALEDGGRPVAVYTITDAGSAEFQNLVFDAIATVPDSGDALPLRVALNFGPVMRRSRFLAAVRARVEVLTMGREIVVQKQSYLKESRSVPPHVSSELGLEIALIDAQLGWLEQLDGEVSAGGLDFADDARHGEGWTPAADDPGWHMAAERDRYAARIAEQRRA
ncbi:MAG: PadR family transcriptional regulator [Pseudolysinimonas sp.]